MPGSVIPGPGIKISRIHSYAEAMHRAQCSLIQLIQLSKMGYYLLTLLISFTDDERPLSPLQ